MLVCAVNVELLSLLKVVLKRECFFHYFKLCGVTQAWVECLTSSDIAQTFVILQYV